MTEQKEDNFLVPSLPVKKPSPSTNVKSALSKISSLITPSLDEYVLPSWAEIPQSCDHVIEIMNNGVIAGRHKLKDLAKKGYITVGRMDSCDIRASIPGASRLHCYLQYGDGFHGRGWYVFDKSSTQGTFVNKQEVPKNVYYKAKSGSIIQITKSNFHLSLEGTDEPIKKPVIEEERRSKSPEPNFIDELKAKTEKSFEKDPISILSKFCEREGLEFKFSKLASEDKDNATYAFDLPDDVTGGRGDSFTASGADAQSAQRSCALQVCRHLNEFGLLSADSQRNARTSLQDNEFYEEDEDTFFDRTGQIEEQRSKRIARHKANIGVKEKTLTYSELLAKIEQMKQIRQAVADQLVRLIKPQDGETVTFENVDISTLNIRLEISKLKRKYEQLTGELTSMHKAAELSKPFEMHMPEQSHRSTQINEVKPTTSAFERDASSEEQVPQTSTAMETNDEVIAVKGPAMPPPAKKKDTSPKKFGLLTRQDLQANKNAILNKRKAEEEYFEDDEIVEEKRNKTDESEDPNEVVNWTAPAGQTGDGRTALNDKLGY